MLLAVTPSMLRDLGVGQHQLARLGHASLVAPAGTRRHPKAKRMDRTTGLPVYVVKGVTDATAEGSAAAAMPGDAAALLTAQALAQRMDCTRATVYDREKKGLLFSVLAPGREKGRKFPAFQLHARLDRDLLHELIAMYAQHQAPMNLLWDFLRAVHSEFGGLSGLQLLLRASPQTEGVQAARVRAVYAMQDAERSEYVKDVALEDLRHAFA